MGQKSDRQKVAMRPNGWLYKIILPAKAKRSDSDQHWAYFGYCEYRVTFCLLARLAGTPKLGLAPLPNPLRVGHTTIIVG